MSDWVTGSDKNPLIAKTPPHNAEAEREVLAMCFEEFGGLDSLEVNLRPEEFYVPWHRFVWESMRSLKRRSIPVERLAVKNDLERRGEALSPSQSVDLETLSLDALSSANVSYYARIVHALARKRRLIEAGAKIVELGYTSAPVSEVFSSAQETLFSVTEKRSSSEIQDGEQLAGELYAHIQNPDQDQGVVSGWLALDSLVQSFRPGEMSVLGARPSMGKTSMALSLTAAMLERGSRVGIVSLEMDRLQLACNAVGARVSVDTTAIRKGKFVDREQTRNVLGGIEWLGCFGKRLAVFDGVLDSIGDLGTVLRRMVQAHGVQIVWVDYMQLLSGSKHTRGQGRYAEVSEVSIMLKRYARRLGIHLGVLAQLNRKVEERSDKKPIMADLRDSGQVEQDADVIMLLNRPEQYWPDKEELRGLATLDVCKNRNGPTGAVRFRFDREYTRFSPA